jgi:hypothetical protein
MLTLNCKSYLQNSMQLPSIIFIKLAFYIVTFVYWNIQCTESYVCKYIRKINKLPKQKTNNDDKALERKLNIEQREAY